MEYTIKELADLAGISTRTLRYYDQIGLLPPAGVSASGYRLYGEDEVDALQQILIYKTLGMELSQIKETLATPEFNRIQAMEAHLETLLAKRKQMEIMIDNVKKTIKREKGLITMTDREKFEGLKQENIKINEVRYGEEIRRRYGDDAIEKSNEKMLNLTKEEYDAMERTGAELLSRLEAAVERGNLAAGPEGRESAMLHKKWLCYTLPSYTKELHKGIVEMYTADERFKNYYDSNVAGCAEFLRDAVKTHF